MVKANPQKLTTLQRIMVPVSSFLRTTICTVHAKYNCATNVVNPWYVSRVENMIECAVRYLPPQRYLQTESLVRSRYKADGAIHSKVRLSKASIFDLIHRLMEDSLQSSQIFISMTKAFPMIANPVN